jgi:hypothetical protein
LAAWVGLALGALGLAVAATMLVFDDAILNGYGRGKVERAFTKAHPGYALRIGELRYSLGGNRLTAQSATLSATNLTLQAGRISLTSVRWARLFWGTATLADVLAEAAVDAANLVLEFPKEQYGISCARLRMSAPDSELIVEGAELRTLLGDEEFFAARQFRTTRFHLVVPECRVRGLDFGELLAGTSCRARSVHFSGPAFEALVNRDKPAEPFVKAPLMVHEALAAIRQPLRIDGLSITNASLRYCERVVAGAEPGVLTFGDVSMSVEGIANHVKAPAAIQVQAQGELMDAGTLKVTMSIPIATPDFSLHYSGSLSAMNLPRLDAFLDTVEHTRIKSGSAQSAAFEIDVAAGQARGRVLAIYKDLEIAVLDKQTGTDKRLDHRMASFLANALKIRKSNAPDAAGAMKAGEVDYTKRPEDEFLQFAWFALRTGLLDVISQ